MTSVLCRDISCFLGLCLPSRDLEFLSRHNFWCSTCTWSQLDLLCDDLLGSCGDFLLSRNPFWVATSVLLSLIHSSQRRFIFWSRPLNDVATLITCKLSLIPTLGTIPYSVLMSRPLLNVAPSMYSLLKILCCDFYSMSRPPCLLLSL